MTIAISVKVHNGIVLAADSASTLFGAVAPGKMAVVNIFNNARKIFNLYKGMPIGLMTWGAGSIGHASIATLAKDLRLRLMDQNDETYRIDKDNYTLQEVATKTKQFFFMDTYQNELKNNKGKLGEFAIGFIIAGYSKGETLPEEWEFNITKMDCSEPTLIRQKQDTGISWRGEGEAVMRLVRGYGGKIGDALKEIKIPNEKIKDVMTIFDRHLRVPLSYPPMPIQDAIDLANFLCQATIMFSRFTPGASVVGGPTDVAAITKHEGFRWVSRKFWYQAELNPKEVPDDN